MRSLSTELFHFDCGSLFSTKEKMSLSGNERIHKAPECNILPYREG
jgi:hypothetical protein